MRFGLFERLWKADSELVIKRFSICATHYRNGAWLPKACSIRRLLDRELVLQAAKLQKLAPHSLNQRP